MFDKKATSCFVLFFLVLIPLYVSGQDSIKSKPEIIPNVEIILNKIKNGGFSGIKSRHLFILVEEKDFNLENVRKWFDKYKNLYPEPHDLNISLYSNREMLQRLIDFQDHGTPIEFNRDEKGKEAARKFYEKYYPLPSGYFRAEYIRYSFEYLDYSPKKEDSEMIRIYLKKLNGDNESH